MVNATAILEAEYAQQAQQGAWGAMQAYFSAFLDSPIKIIILSLLVVVVVLFFLMQAILSGDAAIQRRISGLFINALVFSVTLGGVILLSASELAVQQMLGW